MLKYLKQSPTFSSFAVLICFIFLPLSAWANSSQNETADTLEKPPAFWVNEMDRHGLSYEIAQYEYTDHSMRFELPASPSSGGQPAESQPAESQPSSGSSSSDHSMTFEKKGPGSFEEPSYQPIFRGRYEDDSDPFEAEQKDIPELTDPFSGYNHFMDQFNHDLYSAIIDPVSQFYKDVVHVEIRVAIRNLFRNALAPVRLVSSLIQLNLEKAGRVLSRVLINTILGIGGLFDVAKKSFGIQPVSEDFGQALGYHGVPPGPYIVLPILGPSTGRDLVGRIVDSFLSPAVVFAPGLLPGLAISGTYMINENSFYLEGKKHLEADAIDRYESLRDFYHQYREQQIRK